MFCRKCGTEIVDQQKFCSQCGEPVELEAQAPSEVPENPDSRVSTDDLATVYAPEGGYSSSEKKFPTKILLIAGIAIAAILATVLIIVFAGSSPEGVAEDYVFGMGAMDVADMLELEIIDTEVIFNELLKDFCDEKDITEAEFFEKIAEACEDQYDTDAEFEDLNGYFEFISKQGKEDLEDRYGDYKIRTQVTDSEKLSTKKMKTRIENLETALKSYDLDFDDYFNKDAFTEAYLVTVEAVIENEDGRETEETTIAVVDYDGDWLVMETNVFSLATRLFYIYSYSN